MRPEIRGARAGSWIILHAVSNISILARPHRCARDSRNTHRDATCLPENLERVLSSTNLIENLFSRVRAIGRRVRHWQSGTMVLRWTAAGVLEAERGFRKVTGYRAMPALVAALAFTILIVPDRQLTKLKSRLTDMRPPLNSNSGTGIASDCSC